MNITAFMACTIFSHPQPQNRPRLRQVRIIPPRVLRLHSPAFSVLPITKRKVAPSSRRAEFHSKVGTKEEIHWSLGTTFSHQLLLPLCNPGKKEAIWLPSCWVVPWATACSKLCYAGPSVGVRKHNCKHRSTGSAWLSRYWSYKQYWHTCRHYCTQTERNRIHFHQLKHRSWIYKHKASNSWKWKKSWGREEGNIMVLKW